MAGGCGSHTPEVRLLGEESRATPTPDGTRVYVRTVDGVWCIGR